MSILDQVMKGTPQYYLSKLPLPCFSLKVLCVNIRILTCSIFYCPSRNVSEPLKGNRQTNQRAELTAITRALDIAPRHRDVTIYTDSKYAIDCVTVWFVKWQRNKWMTADHKPVENKDLIQSILKKIEERTQLNVKTLFEWVKGHNRDPGNEAADRLALNGAKNGVQRPLEEEELSEEKNTELKEDSDNDDEDIESALLEAVEGNSGN